MISRISGLSKLGLYYSLLVMVFLLPISLHLTIIFFNILCILWFISGIWWNSKPDINQNKELIGLILFWLLHVISLLYSSDHTRGFNDVVQKLAFVLFPLIFLTTRDKLFPFIKKILWAFVLGLIVVSALYLLNATYNSIGYTFNGLVFNPTPVNVPWENYYFHQRLAIHQHPTYLSMFYAMGIAILFHLIKRGNYHSYKEKVGYASLILLFIIMIILLSSRAGVVTGALVLILGLLWLYFKRTSMLTSLLIFGVIILMISVFALNNSRFSILLKGLGVEQASSVVDDNALEKKLIGETLIRINIWQSIPDVMKNHWLIGYGIGDSKQALQEGYKKKGITYAYEYQFNAHNQFLETLVALGLVGLLLLLLLVISTLQKSLKDRNFLLISFILIVGTNFMFESILERIAGVMFFGFFLSLLLTLEANHRD